MANLIEYIQSQVYENSTEDISGSIMQQVLTRMASDEGVVNVHTISGQTPFADYNNAQAARGAVPDGFKKLGLIITYKLSSGWYIDEFIGSATSGWSTASNWKCLGPISVSQNASTGKTTITIGSESYDVATQPVSVSQNTITGGDELNIGESTKPIVGVQVNQKKNTDFAIHGLIYANGTITDADASPYRRTNVITLLPNEVIMVYSSIQSASGSHLNIYADSACTELIQSFAGIEDDTNVYRKTYVNNTGSTVYAIMCGDSRNGFDKTIGIFGDSLYYKDLLSINAQAIQSVHNELLQVENSESFSIDTVFVNPGIVESNGVIVSTPASAYRMTAPILLRTGEKITVRAYGSSGLNPIAVFGDNLLTKFQRVINGIVPEQGEDYGFGIFSYENKSGFDMYIICTTHNSKQNECWCKIDDAQQTNNDVLLDIADIYKEKGVCIWTTKTYTHNNSSPYVTRFIPVKENQLVYMYNGSYPSTFEVFACDASKQYVESPINLRGSERNDELIKHYITIRIPQGIDYIGITNREDELTNPQLKVYQSNLYVNAKVRPIIKDYDLSPNKGHIAFVVDGAYNADADLKALFDQKGIKAGWAPVYPVYYPGYYGMDMHMDWYMQWQNEGHEILTHSGPDVVWNDINYSVPSNPTEQAAFAKMRIEQFRNIGFITRGFVQSGSQKFSTEEARKPIYNSYEYGFTRATNEITEPDQGAVMMPTDKPWNLGRSTLEVITLAQMKSLIDECASKKGFLCIYLHSWRIGNAQYPNQTWATMAEMMDYALSKCVVDIPYNCIKALYANHIE